MAIYCSWTTGGDAIDPVFLEIDPRTDKIVWKYEPAQAAGFFTMTRGGAQRLPNGNTLIASVGEGRAFEVTPDGKKVWEYYTRLVTTEKFGRPMLRHDPFYRMERIGADKVEKLLSGSIHP